MIKTRTKTREYCSKKAITEYKEFGKSEKSILEPSRGGIGTRLNIANPKLIKTIEETTETKLIETVLFIEKRKTSPKKIAKKRLDKTPAAATAIVPHFLLVRLFGLYGTGFAQPNKNGE